MVKFIERFRWLLCSASIVSLVLMVLVPPGWLTGFFFVLTNALLLATALCHPQQ